MRAKIFIKIKPSFFNFLAQVKIASGGVLNALPSDDHLTKSHLTLGKAWDEVRFDKTGHGVG